MLALAQPHRFAQDSSVATLLVDARDRETRGVALPRPEVHLVARFGLSASGGLDLHAMGSRQVVHRKLLRRGWAVTARLQLGATEAVLGVPAAAIAGQIVSLEDLWGDGAARLTDQLGEAHGPSEAAAILERALAARAGAPVHRGPMRLVLQAAERLSHASVNAVADELGVSERHLRRLFQETLGVGPKKFAQVTRFGRAVRAAREAARVSWGEIAAGVGYYDQAHLIADFHAIAGVTPQALLGELRAAQSLG